MCNNQYVYNFSFLYVQYIMMKIQVASDLHIDICKTDFSKILIPSAKYLILAGDISEENSSTYYDFLEWVKDKYEMVYVVLGNHEYYNCDSMENVITRIRNYCDTTSTIILLERDHVTITIDDIIYHILGATMWSYIPKNKAKYCEDMVNDYKLINPKLSVIKTNKMHMADSMWLLNEMKTIPKQDKIIVVTHHAPLYNNISDPKYEVDTNIIRNAFSTDMKFIFENPISVWIYGHTHYVTDFIYGTHNTRIISNCRGYNDIKNYSSSKTFEL